MKKLIQFRRSLDAAGFHLQWDVTSRLIVVHRNVTYCYWRAELSGVGEVHLLGVPTALLMSNAGLPASNNKAFSYQYYHRRTRITTIFLMFVVVSDSKVTGMSPL